MTIKECYSSLCGDYDQVCKRIPSEKLIKKFVVKFLDDGSFNDLCNGIENGNGEEAFRAAHTLKSVCGNLNFDKLFASSSELTELLRKDTSKIPEEAESLFTVVKEDYNLTVSAIRDYLEHCDE